MTRKLTGLLPIILFLTLTCHPLCAQEDQVLTLVNPWIGTAKTKITSLWGKEGGTYPGAVAPFGHVQLTPETRAGSSSGYFSGDSTIFYFSCFNHRSGYPGGSAGQTFVMPVLEKQGFIPGQTSRTFRHRDEKASPGYYSVLFRDNGTLVEVSASERAGMFRITFPEGIRPRIFLGDMGKITIHSKRSLTGTRQGTMVQFNAGFTDKTDVKNGCVLSFPTNSQGGTVLVLRISNSGTGPESSELNLEAETGSVDFDQYLAGNQKKWKEALSVISVRDSSLENKTIFYTALYHSMLIPWIISDVRGSYKGEDGLVHQAKGACQYTMYSPWDTFRSLHPLLTLIAPDRQNDMMVSMLEQYRQTGKLPKGPMTGNHVIPILADALLKGVDNLDIPLAYQAMQDALKPGNNSKDFAAYLKIGYVPSTFSESVTQTVEYAYDDWALAQVAGKIMNNQSDCRLLMQRSMNYRNLYGGNGQFLLPRKENTFMTDPGNFGYKEGDKWSYSLFVPHNIRDLINRSGGDREFTNFLDTALLREKIPFDNEPVLHVPYLFNYAKQPDKTRQWVRKLMTTHYNTSPDGIPGNDDLGSMSSWYVFSAMGFYPVCPGRPIYDLGIPRFEAMTLHLKNGKKFTVNAPGNSPGNPYVGAVTINGTPSSKLWISHAEVTRGGDISFQMQNSPTPEVALTDEDIAPSETISIPDFQLSGMSVSHKQVLPDQLVRVRFSLQNKGSIGTKVLRLYVDGREYGSKSLTVKEHATIRDSMDFRLYRYGKRVIRFNAMKELEIEVLPVAKTEASTIDVTNLQCASLVKKDQNLDFQIMAQNKGGAVHTDTILVFSDDQLIRRVPVSLEPGEMAIKTAKLTFSEPGFHLIKAGNVSRKIKVYDHNREALLLNAVMSGNLTGNQIPDHSGFENHGSIRSNGTLSRASGGVATGKNSYIEFSPSPSLDRIGDHITLMAWVYPVPAAVRGISDILTKGDHMALQTDGKRISFFAGGWGRGDCSAPLPADWHNNWHCIAGVSDGRSLKIFLDGAELARQWIDDPVNLSCSARWMVGRNEEFPDQRYFCGNVANFRLFAEALTAAEIKEEMYLNRPAVLQEKH